MNSQEEKVRKAIRNALKDAGIERNEKNVEKVVIRFNRLFPKKNIRQIVVAMKTDNIFSHESKSGDTGSNG